MQYSFGDDIKRFAQAVDAIDDEGLRRFRDIVEGYIEDTLNIVFTRLYYGAEGEGGEKLLIPYRLARRNVYKGLPIKTPAGEYASHIAYAYDKQVKLWITADPDSKSKLLSQCDAFLDHWPPRETDLPAYTKPTEDEIRTSIIIPLRDEQEGVFGVLNFETTEYLDITEIAKRELKTITEAIAIIYRTSMQSAYQRSQTNFALDQLADHANQAWPKLTKPKIFVASSARSPEEVVKCINTLLESEYADKLQPIYWKDMSGSGNIDTQLLTVIAACRFGICYFSEKTSRKKTSYKDNSNVVFEAGMLHGRSDMSSPSPASWIPVREENSPESPFDFAHERTVVVPRDAADADEFKPEEFMAHLRERLNALID